MIFHSNHVRRETRSASDSGSIATKSGLSRMPGPISNHPARAAAFFSR